MYRRVNIKFTFFYFKMKSSIQHDRSEDLSNTETEQIVEYLNKNNLTVYIFFWNHNKYLILKKNYSPILKSLATATVQLFLKEKPDDTWNLRYNGVVVCLVKDPNRRSYYFYLYKIEVW